jgi:hypothetical protein
MVGNALERLAGNDPGSRALTRVGIDANGDRAAGGASRCPWLSDASDRGIQVTTCLGKLR